MQLNKILKQEIFRFALVGGVATIVLYAAYWLALRLLQPSWAYT